MAHCTVDNENKILDKEFKVLDHGFVRLVDYLGDDSRIVSSARVSYQGLKKRTEDANLIDYLMRNNHTSPFEQVVFTFHVKMPIFVARQWQRHRTARINEISGRYTQMKEEFYIPSKEECSYQSTDNRQGRGELLSDEDYKKYKEGLLKSYETATKEYKSMIERGVAKEIARIVLPLSLYTEFYWQIDAHNLLHFLSLRLDPHAQLEIRHYAKVIFSIIKEVIPETCKAFEKHILKSKKFTSLEMDAIKKIIQGEKAELLERDSRILFEKFKD